MTHIKTTHTPLPTPSKATRSRATMTRGTMSPVRRAIVIRKKEEEAGEEEATRRPTIKNPTQATSKITNKKPTMMNQLIIQKIREARIAKEEGANGKRNKLREEDITGTAHIKAREEEEGIRRKRAMIRDMATVASSSSMEVNIMTQDMGSSSSSIRVVDIKTMERPNIKIITRRVVATLLRAVASGRKKRSRNREKRRKQRQLLRKTGESIKSMETMGHKTSRLRTMQD